MKLLGHVFVSRTMYDVNLDIHDADIHLPNIELQLLS